MDRIKSMIQPHSGTNYFPHIIGGVFLLLWVILAINPVDRWDWLVENILVVISFIGLGITYRFFRFSNFSYLCIFILLSLHAIGAHYTYGQVPFSISIPGLLDASRNNFDRIVHFGWGLFMFYPIYEVLLRIGRISINWVYGLTTAIVIATGSLFELIEMWGSKLMAKELAAAYLGIQGDIWDPHEDIAMALYGSAIMMVVLGGLRLYWLKRRRPHSS